MDSFLLFVVNSIKNMQMFKRSNPWFRRSKQQHPYPYVSKRFAVSMDGLESTVPGPPGRKQKEIPELETHQFLEGEIAVSFREVMPRFFYHQKHPISCNKIQTSCTR